MSTRFEPVTEDVTRLVETVQEEFFPELSNIKILVLFDTKKRKSGIKYVVGRMTKTNELTRYLSLDETEDGEGFDYIMYLDKYVFMELEGDDRVRIVRHEMRHIEIDTDAKNPFKLKGHDVEDFYEEVELNSDDLRWVERVGQIAESVHSEDQ